MLSPPSQDITPCVLAIVLVNSTPPGTCVLERLAQIVRDREQQHQQQQEQQKSSNATNFLQSTTTSTSSTAVDQEDQGEEDEKGGVVSLTRRADISPDRTRSPSPRLAEQRQRQQEQLKQGQGQEQEQQGLYLTTGKQAPVDQDRSWRLRVELLETELDALRRWKLKRLIEEDRARLQDIEVDGGGASSCRVGSQRRKEAAMARRRGTGLNKNLVARSGLTSTATLWSPVEDGLSVSKRGTTSRQSRHDDTAELSLYSHRLLSLLEIVRQSQFSLEQMVVSSENQSSRADIPTSLWNVSISSNLVQAIKVVTSMFCSLAVRCDVSERAYLQIMDTVQECMVEPFLTQGQYNTVLQALESSWETIIQLLPILSVNNYNNNNNNNNNNNTERSTTIPPTPSFYALPLARFGAIAQYLIQQLQNRSQQQLQQQQQQRLKGVVYHIRCLGGILRILLTVLIQTLDALQLDTPHQQQQHQCHDGAHYGGGGDGVDRIRKRTTRLSEKNQTAARLELAKKDLQNRGVARRQGQGHQYLQEEACGRMVEIAVDVLSAFRLATSSLLTGCEYCCRQQRFESRESKSCGMGVSQECVDGSKSSSACNCVNCGDDVQQGFQHVEDECNVLMSHIWSRILFSPDTTKTKTIMRSPGPEGRGGIPLWLTERLFRLVSIDCFQ